MADKDKADALKIAFDDPRIYKGISDNGGKYIANVTPDGGFDNSGYINVSGKFMLASIQWWERPVLMRFQVLADVENDREMEARYTYDVVQTPARVLIPAGSGWFRSVKYAGNLNYTSMSVVLEPENVTIYPTIMSKENFEHYRNGLPFNALRYVEYSTGGSAVYNGKIPATSAWSANVSLNNSTDGLSGDGNLYFVLDNNDSRDAIAYISIFPPGG